MSVPLSHITGILPETFAFTPWHGLVLPVCAMGVEVELEGYYDNVLEDFRSKLEPYWSTKNDNSLRNGGIEVVFPRPLFGKDVKQAIEVLERTTAKFPPVISERCSTHVHLDVRDLSTEQLIRLVLLYTMYEKAIVQYHGGVREKNIFCLPFYVAPANLSNIGLVLHHLDRTADARELLYRIGSKYSALNLRALFDYGSVEFRHMPGEVQAARLLEWINIIQCFKKAAIDIDVPALELEDYFRRVGMEVFTEQVFGNLSEKLQYPEFKKGVYQGLRLVREAVARKDLDTVQSSLSKRKVASKHSHLAGNLPPEL